MSYRFAINGFGRIGRMVLRAWIETGSKDGQIVGINDLSDAHQLAHLLKYDSVHGRFPGEVSHTDSAIIVNGQEIPIFSQKDPENLPWADLDVDIVMECTGFFLTQELCQKHIKAGARRVLISAPAKDNTKTIVFGVNHGELSPKDAIVSNASCTTNALAPLVHVLNNTVGIQSGVMTTIHAYTGDQPTHDSVHKDFNRGRAAMLSMVPTSTGAAKAISKVIPAMDGKLDGMAVRVPVPNVSMVDLSVVTNSPTHEDEIRQAFEQASQGELKGILGYIDDPRVSIDQNHDPHSSSFIADKIYVSNASLVKIMAWYDNEWGFSNRMLDTARVISTFL